ncbi:ABC transporter ATP-binding protein [Pseudonocardia sp. GCM10023141]|uniref:ABC transporter ATP-binding protein n=1 Tax=Pseudonocardia sp. GCM10023141 TaxID=3252653 RepID=UPI00360CA231
MTDPVLDCRGLAVAFGGNQVLDGIDLTAGPGFNGLIGPNGAGKTTLFNVITGYVRPQAGEVLLEGTALLGRGPAAVSRAGVARTFQTPKLIQDMSAVENAMLGVDGARRLADWRALLGLPASERRSRAEARALLGEFGLARFADEPVANMPLGSQKLVEVVRALLTRPRVLLLDEPAAGVSSVDVARMTEPLVRVAERDGLCIVIIEHDLELVAQLCPTVTVLDFGRVLAVGPPAEVTRQPEVVRAYLGVGFVAADE